MIRGWPSPQGFAGFLYRRRRHHPPSALRFAGVGYRPGDARVAEAGLGPDSDAGPARDAMAARKGMPGHRRLAGQLPGGRALRMVLRVFQSALSRCGRHRNRARLPEPTRRRRGRRRRRARGIKWLLNMQNEDGGWAAFDRTIDRPMLEKIPFADHNAMQDPSCPDIAGRVLEGLGHCRVPPTILPSAPAIAFIRKHQDPCGGWWGRWGVQLRLRNLADSHGPESHRRGHEPSPTSSAPPTGCEASKTRRQLRRDRPELWRSHIIGKTTKHRLANRVGRDGHARRRCRKSSGEKPIDWLIEHQSPDGDWEENFFTRTGLLEDTPLWATFRLTALSPHYHQITHPAGR